MMGKLKPEQLLRILLLSAICLPTTGQAVSVSLVAGPEVARSSTSNKTRSFTSDSLLNVGAGSFVEFHPIKNYSTLGLETGLLYVKREISYGAPANEVFTILEVPLLVRFNFSRYSLGLGGYLAEGIGRLSLGTPGSHLRSDITYSDGGVRPFEYGLTVAWSYALSTSIFAEFRYNRGLRNIAQASDTTFRFDDFQLFFGWHFFEFWGKK